MLRIIKPSEHTRILRPLDKTDLALSTSDQSIRGIKSRKDSFRDRFWMQFGVKLVSSEVPGD
jgi:hypothetical protein